MSIKRILKALDALYSSCPVISIPQDFKGAAISDCHLGVGDGADDFTGDNALLLDLNSWEAEGRTLLIIGDFSDRWENKREEDIRWAHRRVWDKVKGYVKLIQVNGNHDPSSTHFDAIKLQYPSGRIILITHGHKGTWACDQASWIGKLFVRYIWAGIGQRVFGLKDPSSARQDLNPSRHEEVRQAHDEWARLHHEDDLIYGHLHAAYEAGNVHNTGTRIGDHREYVLINGGKIHLAAAVEGMK